MPKAIQITKENKHILVGQYMLEDDQLDGTEGMILVSEFGESTAIEGLLTPAKFTELYQITEKNLLNGYVDVVKRVLTP